MNYKKTVNILETDRLLLRYLTVDDIDDLKIMLQDIEVMYAWEHAFSIEEVNEWLEKNLKRYKEDGVGYFAAIDKNTMNFVGQIGILFCNINNIREVEIGWILKKEFWHNGYATEGAKVCRDYIFNILKMNEITITIRPENISSCKVAEKIGAKVVGEYIKKYNNMDMLHLIYKIYR